MRQVVVLSVLALALATTVSARAEGVRIGLGAGYVDPSDVGGTAFFTGNVRFDVARNVALEPEVGYWKKSESVPGLVDVSIKDLNFGVNVLYQFPTSGSLRFSAGAGLGAHVLKGAVGVLGFSESASETKLGGQLLAGLDLKVSSAVALFANARYDLVSDFNQFKVYGGVRFGL
jgi:hypothetical protein